MPKQIILPGPMIVEPRERPTTEWVKMTEASANQLFSNDPDSITEQSYLETLRQQGRAKLGARFVELSQMVNSPEATEWNNRVRVEGGTTMDMIYSVVALVPVDSLADYIDK